jgi:hypothetical protein
MHLLVSWCAGGRSRRPGAEDRGWSHRSGTRWSGGVVCDLHLACGDLVRGFLGGDSKPRSTVCEWFDLKTIRTVFTGLASKPVATVSSGLASKPAATVFSSLASKLVAMVSLDLASKSVVGFFVEPQNQGGGGFLGLGLKTGSSGLVILASKSP